MSIARLELDQDTESCDFHNVDINICTAGSDGFNAVRTLVKLLRLETT